MHAWLVKLFPKKEKGSAESTIDCPPLLPFKLGWIEGSHLNFLEYVIYPENALASQRPNQNTTSTLQGTSASMWLAWLASLQQWFPK